MFDSLSADMMSRKDIPNGSPEDYEPIEDEAPCESCGGVGFGGCICDEVTMVAMDEDDRREDEINQIS